PDRSSTCRVPARAASLAYGLREGWTRCDKVVHDHHGAIGNPADKPYGNGVLLWFEIDDFDNAIERIAELKPEIACRAIATPRVERAVPTTGRFGCAIPTVTRSYSRAQMDRRMVLGDPSLSNLDN